MKIPDDVTIKITDKDKNYGDKEILDRVRYNDDYALVRLWLSDDLFRLLAGDCEVAKGHFVRTVKTRRVVWDLPEGFEIPGDTKAMLEKTILEITDWRDGSRAYNAPWSVYEYSGGNGSACYGFTGFAIPFRVTESTEELPWSPFDEAKKGTE